jgi:hypothetical protein
LRKLKGWKGIRETQRGTINAADIIGIGALFVHAKDDKAREWYEKLDLESSPTDKLHLFLW